MDLLERYIQETHSWAKNYIYERFAIDVWDLPFLPKVDINIRYTVYDSYELEFVYYKKNGDCLVYWDVLNSIMFIHMLYHLEVISESDFYSLMETDNEDFYKFLLENKHMKFTVLNQLYDIEELDVNIHFSR